MQPVAKENREKIWWFPQKDINLNLKQRIDRKEMANYIRFDWAMKRLLRNKANHAVLEGLMTSLLNEKFTIVNFLESEGNQDDENDKFNRVDILAEGAKGELVIFEIQNSRELTYFHRMLYGVSKAVTDYIHLGEGYGQVRKVYSVNIVYFGIGQGRDYVYHGTTVFRGMHQSDDILHLSKRQQELFFGEMPDVHESKEAGSLFPEYFLLKVNDFDKVATTPLDEWISFLKTGEISSTATAPGLAEARRCLAYDRLTEEEKIAYKHHMDNLVYQKYTLETSYDDGVQDGIKKGIEQGLQQGLQQGIEQGEKLKAEQIARRLLSLHVPVSTIMTATGLSEDEIGKLSV